MLVAAAASDLTSLFNQFLGIIKTLHNWGHRIALIPKMVSTARVIMLLSLLMLVLNYQQAHSLQVSADRSRVQDALAINSPQVDYSRILILLPVFCVIID